MVRTRLLIALVAVTGTASFTVLIPFSSCRRETCFDQPCSLPTSPSCPIPALCARTTPASAIEGRELSEDAISSSLSLSEKRARQRPSRTFDGFLEELEAYYEQNGHCDVKENENPDLYEWVSQVRGKHRHQALNMSSPKRRMRLSAQRMKRLKNIGFVWQAHKDLRHRSRNFDVFMSQLERFHLEHGHSDVPKEEYPELFHWMKRVRYHYRSQVLKSAAPSHMTLSETNLNRLKRVDFSWYGMERKRNFEKKYNELCDFVEANGHCKVPYGHPLRDWTQNARRRKLSADQYDKLDQLGFWDLTPRPVIKWEQHFEELLKFNQTNGHTNVPQQDGRLGQWVMNQRTHYVRFLAGLPSCITPDRIEQLNSVNFRWNHPSFVWSRNLEKLKEYRLMHNTTEISFQDDSNRRLRQWMYNQKYAYHLMNQNKTSSMTERRASSLEKIPSFAWNSVKPQSNPGRKRDMDAEWTKLVEELKKRGGRIKKKEEHFYEGPLTDEQLLALWNEGED